MPERIPVIKVENVPVETVKPYWRNPRKNDAAVPLVRESIKAFGFNQPLVVDKKGVIIVGHTRYRAALELNLENVPVIRANHLSQKDAKAYRIADNKTGEVAEWDRTALVPELRESDLNLMGLFFDEHDLSTLLGSADGHAFKPVDADAMDRALNRQQSEGPGVRASSTAGAGFIMLTCPHCCEDFQVSRSAVETGPGER